MGTSFLAKRFPASAAAASSPEAVFTRHPFPLLSAAMTPEFFRTIVAEALTDAERTARVVRSFAQAPDHPQALNFPEGYYLTGLQLAISN